MDEKEMASDRGYGGSSSSSPAGTAASHQVTTELASGGNKMHLHIGKRSGGDSVSHSNEDLHLSNSEPLSGSHALNDSETKVEPALEALELINPEPAHQGAVASAAVASPTDVTASDDDDMTLAPMTNIDDSAFLVDSNDKTNDISSRVSSNDDIGPGDVSRSERDVTGGTSDMSSTPVSANTLSDFSEASIFKDPLHDKELNRSTNGHASDGSSRGLRDSTNASINSSFNSNSSTSVNKPFKSADKKKKGSYWYNSAYSVLSDPQSYLKSSSSKKKSSRSKVLSPTYKSRSEDFKRIFKVIPNTERLMVDYSCALQKEILVHGRLYITQNWICFYANIFRWETVLTIRCTSITSMTKEKTARVIPNAIQICADGEKYFFTSFGTRDKTYLMLFRVWQNALMDQPMSPQELWQWVHYSYGEELGLTSSDDDYMAPTQDEEEKFQKILTQEEMNDTQEKDAIDESEVVLNAGENGHVLPIPSPASKLSSPSAISTNSDNASLLTNSTEDMPEVMEKEPAAAAAAPRVCVASGEKRHLEVPSSGGVGSNDLPTDQGDTTEEEEDEEAQCVGHDHPGFNTLDEVFNLSCDDVFELLFTESEFYKEFVKARKTYDLVLSPWPVEPDFENRKTRMITYTLSLNYSIGPKCSPSTEKQTLYGDSKPGELYIIDCEVVNGGIPYGDNFYVVNRYCIGRVNSRKTRVRVTSDLRYKKTVWGLVKNIIEKNAHTGLNENFSLLAQHLRDEAEKKQIGGPQAAAKGAQHHIRKMKKRRRRCHSNTDRSPSIKRASEIKMASAGHGTPVKGGRSKDEWMLQFNADTVVRVVCTVLLLLLLFNAILFYRLWSLEARAASPRYDRQSLLNDLGSHARTQEEWLALLEQQQQLHDLELERWKDILSSSVQLMEQMKSVLQGLHLSIEKRTRMTMGAQPEAPPAA